MKSPYRFLAYTLLPLIRSRIWTVQGLENLPTNGGFILAANHQSWIDSAVLAAAVYRRLKKPLKFVSQSTHYRAFGALAIDPQNRGGVVDAAVGALEAGYPIVIFPEGNSNNNPELRFGKTGVARLALRTGLPVIPVGIKGPRGVHAWRAMIWFVWLIRPCHVEIGEPMTFPKTKLNEHESELLRDTTEKILEKISGLSGKPMPGQGPALGQRGMLWFIAWRLFRPLVQWRVRVQGAEYMPKQGPFIVVANHGSYFDAPALTMAVFHVTGLQPMFPTKASVSRSFERLAGRNALNALGMLPLNNADKGSVLLSAIDHLRRGGVIGIFPEGTRNKPVLNPRWETEMLKGKTGVARLIISTGAAVIPVSIKAPPGLGIFESVFKGLLPWNFIRVKFGPAVAITEVPTTLEQATKNDLDRLTAQVMTRVASLNGIRYPY